MAKTKRHIKLDLTKIRPAYNGFKFTKKAPTARGLRAPAPGDNGFKFMRRTKRELSWTAHHEAAHAVAALRLRPNSRGNVTIVPDARAETLGTNQTEESHIIWGEPEATIDPGETEATIIETLAGYFGSVRAGCPTDRAKLGAGCDDEQAAALLKMIGGKRAAFRKKTEQFVVREWKAIVAVARELLLYKTLDEYEVELIADVGRPEARSELAAYRASIGGQGTAYAKLAASGELPRTERRTGRKVPHGA